MSDLQQPHRPDPAEQLSRHAYHQLIHTLISLLPPPLADTPESLLTRNQAAIAKVAALAPVNDDEADLAAHCVAARARAEDVLRQASQHAGDIHMVMKINAQFALMERTAVSMRGQLQRLQTARQKREADSAAADADEWSVHIAARRIQQAMEQAPAADALAAGQLALSLLSEAQQAPAPETSPASQASLPPEPAEATRPPPTASAPIIAQPPHRAHGTAKSDPPPRDLAAEADHYAIAYPYRARPIRLHGGLPPDYDFGPPDDDLVRAIADGTSPTLRALDFPAAAAA